MCTDALSKWIIVKDTNVFSSELAVAGKEARNMMIVMGLKPLTTPPTECCTTLANIIAAKVGIEITGMSAHRAITVGPFIANDLLNAVDNDAPLVRAVHIYVAEGSEAGLHAITAAARHSTGSAAAGMLGITNNIQHEIDAGIPGHHLHNFFDRPTRGDLRHGTDDN